MSRGRDGHAKVYVGDLPRDASDKDLEKVFREYGRIKSVWVARNPPGFAFVEFENPRDASDAVNELDGTGRSRPKPWVRGRGYGGRGSRYDSRDGYSGRRGPSGDDRCYECGERGHFAYECHSRRRGRSRDRRDSRDGHRYRRSRTRSRSS